MERGTVLTVRCVTRGKKDDFLFLPREGQRMRSDNPVGGFRTKTCSTHPKRCFPCAFLETFFAPAGRRTVATSGAADGSYRPLRNSWKRIVFLFFLRPGRGDRRGRDMRKIALLSERFLCPLRGRKGKLSLFPRLCAALHPWLQPSAPLGAASGEHGLR